jgi:hypothetical protein
VIAKRRILVPAVAMLVTLAGVLLAANFAGGSKPPPVLDRVSNRGMALPGALNPRDAEALERMPGADDVKLMATHEGRAFYRFGVHCFGTGPVSGGTYRFGALTCTPEFPSRARPLLDLTIFHRHGPPHGWPPTSLTIGRSEGFAADGVASVGFRTPTDAIVGTTRVSGNTYSFSTIPKGPLAALVALDTSDEVVYSVPLQH